METESLDLVLGARVYSDDDATEFINVSEKLFDFYQQEIDYDPAMEETPVYENEQREVKEEKTYAMSTADI